MKFLRLSTLLFFCAVFFSNAQTSFNYGEALQKSIFFYEAQQSGELPDWNRVTWRADSGLTDGQDVGLDLTGGWNDAGDHIKFNFPMAYSVTTLNWGFIDYEDGFKAADQDAVFKQNIKWVTDYFIKCHTAPNEYYAQIAEKANDHSYWAAAELSDALYTRNSYKIDAANPGTDLACETAAALATASMIFKDSDPAYAATLIQHAEELFTFGDTYRGIYSDAISVAAQYKAGSYQDELVWAAIWLYRATGKASYLAKAELEYPNMEHDGKWGFVWEDKSYAVHTLLAQLTDKQIYKTEAERFIDGWVYANGQAPSLSISPGGLSHLTQWGSLRHAANMAFVAFVHVDNIADLNATKKTDYYNFATKQINYALGDNPINRSFVAGFGNNPPIRYHHRTAHGAWDNNVNNNIPEDNRHILYGALVGGPGKPDDTFVDDRKNYEENEVACDYNAAFNGALAKMVEDFGGSALAGFPVAETPSGEFLTIAKTNSLNASGATIAVQINNHTAWPARITEDLSFRYFMDFSEGYDAGYSVADYDVSLSFAEGNGVIGDVIAWDVDNHIYYVEVSFPGEQIMPAGDSPKRREAQLKISVANGVPFDSTNDPSGKDLTSSYQEVTSIPMYDDGVLIYGEESDGGTSTGGSTTPKGRFSVSDTSGLLPLAVTVDASASTDPNNETLSYSWNFGNGETASTATASTTYTVKGTYVITLIVTNQSGDTNTITKTVNAFEAKSCSFGAPSTSALATINQEFKNVHVVGSTGPNLDNISTFKINWNLENKGLYELALNTSNGVPDFYVNLTSNATANFDQANPSVVLSGTGVTGLDGTYWTAMDDGNLALVSQTDDYTIYFSNSAVTPVCGTLGVSSFEKGSLLLYPNPAGNQVVIQGVKNLKGAVVELHSLTGALLLSEPIENEQAYVLNLAAIAQGIYIITIQHDSATYAERLVRL